jgi:hypothetical protein
MSCQNFPDIPISAECVKAEHIEGPSRRAIVPRRRLTGPGRPLRWTAFAALTISAVLAAGCSDLDEAQGPDLARSASFIIGGGLESGYPAVGALIEGGEAFCTGTLVSPTVFVTAAHCLEGGSGAAGLSVFFGSDANRLSSGEVIDAAGAYPHPRYDGWEVVNDIAVITLAEPASVTPSAIQTDPMSASWIGRDAVFVGFGVTDAFSDRAGVKYSVTIPITEVDDTTFTNSGRGVNTCAGDSGGPAFYDDGGTMRLIGVTSWGDEYCEEFGVNTRVDAFMDFVQPFLDGEVPEGGGSSGGGTSTGDFCEEYGWYGDGICDEDCPNPDPDCGGSGGGTGDFCEELGWYGDGICDEDCPNPDPDCEGSGSGSEPGAVGDICAEQGWYGDGICDEDCPNPDPDCEGSGGGSGSSDPGTGGDICEEEGWYGDGVCDEDCAQPDPDCEGSGGGSGSSDPGAGGDLCEEEGWYGDGVCDEDCAQPDPDCGGSDGSSAGGATSGSGDRDECALSGAYGDGVCDEDCPRLDPDCESTGAGGSGGGGTGCSVGARGAAPALSWLLTMLPVAWFLRPRRRQRAHC